MTDSFNDVLTANSEFQRGFAAGEVPGKAGKGLGLVTCMDSRIDPLAVLGLEIGDAKILRTAGALVTDDVLTSLVLAHHALGVDRILILAHTDCGMSKKTDDQVHEAVRQNVGADSRSLEFHTFTDTEATLRHGVQRVRSLPYLPADLPVAGGIYDVKTGAVTIVVD